MLKVKGLNLSFLLIALLSVFNAIAQDYKIQLTQIDSFLSSKYNQHTTQQS